MTKGFRAKSLGEVDREIATEVCFTQGFRAKYMGEVDPEVPLPLPPPPATCQPGHWQRSARHRGPRPLGKKRQACRFFPSLGFRQATAAPGLSGKNDRPLGEQRPGCCFPRETWVSASHRGPRPLGKRTTGLSFFSRVLGFGKPPRPQASRETRKTQSPTNL